MADEKEYRITPSGILHEERRHPGDRRAQVPASANFKAPWCRRRKERRGAAQGADPTLVAVARTEFTPAQLQIAYSTYALITRADIIDTPEHAIALLAFMLTDFTQQTVKEEFLAEAAATVVECVKFNFGLSDGWKRIDKNTPKDKYFEVLGPSGYTSIPVRIEVAMLSSTYHVGRWTTHSRDDYTDGGPEPTHYRELILPPEYVKQHG